jgi:hypothetical protein
VYVGQVARVVLFWLALFDHLIPAPFSIDDASSVFFLGRRSETEIGPSSMALHYQGARSQRRSS